MNIQTKIETDPTNEKELVMIRDFIKDSPNKVENLQLQLQDVYKHYLILEDFSYKVDDDAVEMFWMQKRWPLEIASSLTDGTYNIQNKEVTFMNKLEQEKENFIKSIEQFQEQFKKIKKFSNLGAAKEYAADAFQLKDSLDAAFNKVRMFNDREGLFN